MTLQEYYRNIPEQPSPKSDFVNKVAEKLEVSPATVRTWVNGRNKPSHPSFLRKLSEITGIAQEDLFAEESK